MFSKKKGASARPFGLLVNFYSSKVAFKNTYVPNASKYPGNVFPLPGAVPALEVYTGSSSSMLLAPT